MSPTTKLLCMLLSSLVAATCKLQVTGTGGIGVYQDDLDPNRQVLVWKSFYAQEKGTTFFSVVPPDVYISIYVGWSGTWSESARVLAAPGTAWVGSVDNGLITGFSSAGTCSLTACVRGTVNSQGGFGGYPVWVRLYKGGILMSNYSLPYPGTATFRIDPNSLYFLWGQQQAQVPVTADMKSRAFRVDITSCNAAAPTDSEVLADDHFPFLHVGATSSGPFGQPLWAR